MSCCIAITIPKLAVTSIRDAMRAYQDILETSIAQDQWQCAIAQLGDIQLNPESLTLLTQPIRQSFHPVINILSLGQGRDPIELWAYIQEQVFLHDIRQELITRMQESGITSPAESSKTFIPHVHIGDLQAHANNISIADTPVKTKFSLTELTILQDYAVIGTIPVTP